MRREVKLFVRSFVVFHVGVTLLPLLSQNPSSSHNCEYRGCIHRARNDVEIAVGCGSKITAAWDRTTESICQLERVLSKTLETSSATSRILRGSQHRS
jgi:hypothetical protein